MNIRHVEVAPERLEAWLTRFGDSHGQVSWSIEGPGLPASPAALLASAADGSWARITSWQDAQEGMAIDRWVLAPPMLVVLVRRGGYAVAVTSAAGELAAHKVGTRHVQSRTAAGGWSQQRFARRRSNQADALVEAVVGHAARILEVGEDVTGPVQGLLLGGDRTLCAQVTEQLARGPLARLNALPTRELPDLTDPRRAVLEDAVRRGRALRVQVHNA